MNATNRLPHTPRAITPAELSIVSPDLYEPHELHELYELRSISVLWTADYGLWTSSFRTLQTLQTLRTP